MPTNKHLLMLISILIGCSLVASVVSPFIDSGLGVTIGTCTGLFGLIALSILACLWAKTMTALNTAVGMLKKSRVDEVRFKRSLACSPLLEAVADFITQSASKTDEVEKQATDFNLQLQLLQKEKQNIVAVIRSIKDAVIVTDAFDRVTLANLAAGELFGFDQHNVNLKDIDNVLQDEAFVKLVKRCRSSKLKHVKHEVSFERDNEARTFDCVISCVEDEKGLISGVVSVLHDITREKEISQMKNDFVSHVSHELKTPLASINAYAEMLVDGEAGDQETIDQFCSIIQSQAQRLNRLIEEILNISRIESGLIKVSKEHLSVTIVVQEAAKMIESYAREKNISVHVPTPIIFDQVDADKDMLSQVVINLLSNAVKYTCEGGSVSVDTQINDADGVVTVTVKDTGVGIPTEDVEHVFDKFYRVEANKKYAKGTGLGLNLVKQIVEKVHGGRVFVTSEVGQGSTFGFDVPLAVREAVEA